MPPPPPTRSWRSCDEDRDDRGHAQRALPRLPARPARAGRAQPRRLLVVADADDASRPGARPRVDAARGHAGLRRDAGRRLRRGRRVPLRPPRSRRHPYDEPNALALAVAQAALDVGLPIVVIPAAYHRGGHPRFHDPDVESFLARVDALREWADGRDGVSVAVAAHSVRAVPPDWLEAIAATPATTGCRATSTPPSSRARCATAAPSTAPARSSCSRAPASWDRGRASSTRSTSTSATWRCWPTATRSSSPARRPRATSATACCRRWPTATPGCAWPSARTRRSASTPSRRRASSRPARAGRA